MDEQNTDIFQNFDDLETLESLEQEKTEYFIPPELSTDQQKFEDFFSRINAADSLFPSLVDAVGAGRNKLAHNQRNETFIIDDSWIMMIQDLLFSMELIAKNPKKFIKEEDFIVAVEKAKRTTSRSIRHLASHTNYIRGFDEDDMVIPSKVLTSEFDEELFIYENRFVYSLLKRLVKFVEDRFIAIRNNINSYDTNNYSMSSDFKYGRSEITYNLDMKIKTNRLTSAALDKNYQLLKDLDQIRKRVRILNNSEFARQLSKAKLVFPPIQKTNIIRMNLHYKNCYKLWLFISSFNSLGFSVEIEDKDLITDGDYFEDLTMLVGLSLKTLIANDKVRESIFSGVKYKPKNVKNYRNIERINYKPFFKNELKEKADEINEYYFYKIRELITKTARERAGDVVSVRTLEASFTRFFRQLSKVNQELLFTVLKLPEEKPDKNKLTPIKKKILQLKDAKEVYKRRKLHTKLATSELNKIIENEAKALVKMEKLTFEYESMLLTKPKKKQLSATDKTKYIQKKKETVDSKLKLTNKNLLEIEEERQRKILEKKALAKERRRQKYAEKKAEAEAADTPVFSYFYEKNKP